MSLRRSVALAVVLTLLVASPAAQAAIEEATNGAGRAVPIEVNGQRLSVWSRLWQGVLVAPVRAVAEALGASVTWDATRRQVIIRKGRHVVRLAIGSRWAVVDGRRVELTAAPYLSQGVTHAPLRFLASALGVGLSLDAALARAVITEVRAAMAPQAAPAVPPTAPTAAGAARSDAAPPTSTTPAAAAAPAAAPVSPTAAPARAGRLVLGYYPVDYDGDMLAYRSLAANESSVDLVALFGYRLLPDGSLDGGPADRHLATLLSLARRGGQRVLAVIHNAAWGAFDRDSVASFLRDGAARARAVDAIVRLMARGFAGVNLDLENVAPSDRGLLSAFARQLAEALRRQGYLLTMAVPAKTWDDPYNGWSAAYDYAALGQAADLVVIMAYDEHWATGPAGPVASIGWVRDVVRYAASTMDPRKILLGIPAYGYDWPAWGGARALSAPAAEQLAARVGAPIQWDARAEVPYFRYWDSAGLAHTVYYENASSAAGKVDLAVAHGLAGVAVWRLGLEDPALWKGVIDSKLHWNR